MRIAMLVLLFAASAGCSVASTTFLEATLGSPLLTAPDGTVANVLRGRAFLKAEGSQVYYSLWLQFSEQSTADFMLIVDGGSHGFSADQWRETTLAGANALYPSNPFIVPSTNPLTLLPGTLISLDGWSTINLPTQSDYRVFEGVIDDLSLAQALVGAGQREITVGLLGGGQASGSFFASTPEPSRALFLLTGILSLLHRRRRTLGSG